MDRIEAMILQHFSVLALKTTSRRKKNCDKCQRTKLSNIEYGKLIDKLSEKIPSNKFCVDIIFLKPNR